MLIEAKNWEFEAAKGGGAEAPLEKVLWIGKAWMEARRFLCVLVGGAPGCRLCCLGGLLR